MLLLFLACAPPSSPVSPSTGAVEVATAPDPAARPDPAPLALTAGESVLGVAVPAGATCYCEQRVYLEEGTHISWEACGLPHEADAVRAALPALLGPGWAVDGDGFRRAKDDYDVVVDVFALDAPGPHGGCEAPRPADARSVLMVSVLPR